MIPIVLRFGGVGGDPVSTMLDLSDKKCPGTLDVCCQDPDWVAPGSEYNGEDEYEDDYYGNSEEEEEEEEEEGEEDSEENNIG